MSTYKCVKTFPTTWKIFNYTYFCMVNIGYV